MAREILSFAKIALKVLIITKINIEKHLIDLIIERWFKDFGFL